MPAFALRLDPHMLNNPDADLRYRLPELLAVRSHELIVDDGYDYVGPQPLLVLFFTTAELAPALAYVREVIEQEAVLGCDLRPGAVVAVEHVDGYDVIYPAEFTGPFLPG